MSENKNTGCMGAEQNGSEKHEKPFEELLEELSDDELFEMFEEEEARGELNLEHVRAFLARYVD